MIESQSIAGTSYYMAPEIFNGNQLRKSCDIYSFGIILYEIFTE